MSLLFVFGLPGTGKTFVSTILLNHFGYHFHDGDIHIPEDMKQALDTHSMITEDMRDRFINNLLEEVKILERKYENIVVAQTLIKNRHRQWALEQFPKATFLLVETRKDIREKRLLKRKDYPLDIEYARQMVSNFDPITVPYNSIKNNWEGNLKIIEQLNTFISHQ